MQLASCINGLLTAATAPGLCDHRETGAEGRPGRLRAGAGGWVRVLVLWREVCLTWQRVSWNVSPGLGLRGRLISC